MNSHPAMTPKEMHLHSLSAVAFAHAVHAESFHRVSDQHIVDFHRSRIVVMAEKLEAELAS
jgi:hypothetical protein